MQTLTVCIIAKNEENTIKDCLESIKSVTNEIIVVDTGSTDNTKEIASQYTDKIYDFVWCDDFSAARNETLKHATSDWILVIDCDERLSDPERLKKLLEYKNVDAWLLVQETPCENNKTLCHTTRLFRNHKNIYWQNKIHEVVDVSILQNNYNIGKSSLTLKHLEKPKDLSSKYQWYLDILATDYENPLRYYYIGVCNIALGNYGDGAAYLQEALTEELGKGMKALLHLLIADYFLIKEDFYKAIIHCSKSIELCPKQYRGYVALAGLYISINEFNKALETVDKVINRLKEKPYTDLSNDNLYDINHLEETRSWIYQNIETQ